MVQPEVMRAMTAEEFDRFAALSENADRLLEFIGGDIIYVVSNNYSSHIAMLIGAFITLFVTQRKLGWVTGADGGYRVMGERYIPDVAYISFDRQPQPFLGAYNPNPPDLAVEVLSPGNKPDDMRIKVVNYLRAGTMVWLVDPDLKQIEVYAPDKAPFKLGIDGTLNGGDVLPDFTLAVREIFTA